jgi:hypothetical protein
MNQGNRVDGVRVSHPLFQEGGGGATPTSTLCLDVQPISIERACELNLLWHSRLPKIEASNVFRNKDHVCYRAESGGVIYAVAIWSSPVARLLNDGCTIELRRFAIAPDAPRNTGSRVLAVMARLIAKSKPHIRRLVSYQDESVHRGTVYAAAGWFRAGVRRGGEWSCKSRPRAATQANAPKIRWEKLIGDPDAGTSPASVR